MASTPLATGIRAATIMAWRSGSTIGHGFGGQVRWGDIDIGPASRLAGKFLQARVTACDAEPISRGGNPFNSNE